MVARDGTVAFAVNEDGYSKLFLLKRGAGKRTAIPVPPGVMGPMGFPNWNSEVLTFSIDTPTSPTDVW